MNKLVMFVQPVFSLMLFIIIYIQSNSSLANTSAVVLQYHHVSADTAPSTSITPDQFEHHLNWIKSNQFEILPLLQVVETLSNQKKFKTDKVVAITFDDANKSVCDTAWPLLKEHKIPFTLFISTNALEKNYKSQCSWEQLQDMVRSGLMTPANHSHSHLNMLSDYSLENIDAWRAVMKKEIMFAQEIIQTKLGKASHLFAYPYGEYNTALSSLLSELGFVSFGQHSGAIGYQSNFSELPRFPVSDQHANLNTLKDKLYSLAFPASIIFKAENPIKLSSPNNPPYLVLEMKDKSLLKTTNCFDSKGTKLPSAINENQLIIKPSNKLSPGRHKYTCTSKSSQPNRFYWTSHQWLIE